MLNKMIFDNGEKAGFLIESPKYGQFSVIIDSSDIERIKNYRWHVHTRNGKPESITTMIGRRVEILHRLITGYKMTDHINMNIFDNRRKNLRDCTKSQNAMNCNLRSDNTSGYKGVTRNGNGWRARIVKDKKELSLGVFETKEEAALAYNYAVRKQYGEFARLNIVD